MTVQKSVPSAVTTAVAGSGEPPEVLFSAGQIAARIDALADEVAHHEGLASAARAAAAGDAPPPVAVCALRGAFMFTADLLRGLSTRHLDPDVAFIQVASYGPGLRAHGPVRLVQDLSTDLTGRTVLLMDDILDSGRTLRFLLDHLKGLGAADVVSVVLLDKTARREVPVEADFAGFACPDVFVVGYGMDADGRYRCLPYVGILPGETINPAAD